MKNKDIRTDSTGLEPFPVDKRTFFLFLSGREGGGGGG